LYPNPTTGLLQVEWKGLFGMVTVDVSDIHGKSIRSMQFQSPVSGDYKGSINLSDQPKGIYILKFVSNDKVLIRKVLLQ
jgi:hypothetical protein